LNPHVEDGLTEIAEEGKEVKKVEKKVVEDEGVRAEELLLR